MGKKDKRKSGKDNQQQKKTKTVQKNEVVPKQVKPAVLPSQVVAPQAPPPKKEFPKIFPFWARLKVKKKPTTLVIDEAQAVNKVKKKMEPGYVYREATHKKSKNTETIEPNPDRDDPNPMYLERPSKKPQRLFEPHNKNLDMPKHLKDRYDKNNKRDK